MNTYRRFERGSAALVALVFVQMLTASLAIGQDQQTVMIDDLMWTTTTNREYTNWMEASTYCRELTLAEHVDWRLPTLYELESLYVPDSSAAFKIRDPFALDSCCVWSTTNLEELGEPEDLETIRHEPWLNAWGLIFSNGARYYSYMLQPDGQALCVRDH